MPDRFYTIIVMQLQEELEVAKANAASARAEAILDARSELEQEFVKVSLIFICYNILYFTLLHYII